MPGLFREVEIMPSRKCCVEAKVKVVLNRRYHGKHGKVCLSCATKIHFRKLINMLKSRKELQ